MSKVVLPDFINEIILTTFVTGPKVVKKINVGLSGADVYQLQFLDKNIIVKVVNQELIDSEAERGAQMRVLNLASDKKIAPHVYYSDAKQGLYIMDQILQKPYNLRETYTLNMFTDILKRLHNADSLVSDITKVSLHDYLKYADDNVKQIELNQQVPEVIKLLRSQINRISEFLEKDWRYTLCHVDINPTNLLYDGNSFFLIDWDSARLTDPFIDLATVVNFFLHDKNLGNNLLNIYLGRSPSAEEAKKLFFLEQIVHYFFGTGFLKLAIKSHNILLDNIDLTGLARPLDFYMRLGTGEERLDNPVSQARLGIIMLQTAKNNLTVKEN